LHIKHKSPSRQQLEKPNLAQSVAGGIVKKVLASAAIIATAGLSIATTTAETSAQTSGCNPNTGCLPRPADANQAGGGYAVRPHTLKIERGGPELTAYGMHWSRWTGGYGKHGLIAGRARGTGHLRGCDEGCFSLGRVTIVLSRVTNFGVNAATYYERLHIIGGKHVAHYWHWSQRQDNYVP
jgi:hypothetical protein